MELVDVIIIGGGPAGLNAAVVLGRCRRSVLLFDTESYRNKSSHGMHNYLTRDHVDPVEFIKICHEELKKYGVQRITKRIVNARKNDEGYFVAVDSEGNNYYSKKLLVATGLMDNLPKIPGFEKYYGKSIFHCPYCDGWEVRDKRIGVYARNKNGWELALALKGWTDKVVLYTDGKQTVKPSQMEQLMANDITVVTMPIERVEGNEHLETIVFKNGTTAPVDAIFFVNGFTQQCNLAEAFGCEMTNKGVVKANKMQQTNIEGLYVAGDAARDMHFVVVAAAEGAKAGVSINKELQHQVTMANVEKVAETAVVGI
ncbi:NAD(P)/FAD-dependent oxidoreductase [Aridibaculum aurantiacum]|uniref:NAD(P)/FAD-dependent oxidoreductase n=1 Tax=Aridibaculum aurantiacum TaxID=2810307 RepID=UPI001A9661D9|nr:NAD(P)/FAD-dependent oxidoreductase [Aridibaculum aurantiacum]